MLAPKSSQESTSSATFANRTDAVETVTLAEENGEWKVVGIPTD